MIMIIMSKEGGTFAIAGPSIIMGKIGKTTTNNKRTFMSKASVRTQHPRHQLNVVKPLQHHTQRRTTKNEIRNFPIFEYNGIKSPRTPPYFSKTYSCDDHEEENILIITINFRKLRKLLKKVSETKTGNYEKDVDNCFDICFKEETNIVKSMKQIIGNLLREILIEIIKIIVPTTDIKTIFKSFFPGVEKFLYNTFFHLVFKDLCKDVKIKKLCDKGLHIIVDRSTFKTKVAKLIVKNTVLDKITVNYLSQLKRKQKKIIEVIYEGIQDQLSKRS
jgi:hypothetical protein